MRGEQPCRGFVRQYAAVERIGKAVRIPRCGEIQSVDRIAPEGADRLVPQDRHAAGHDDRRFQFRTAVVDPGLEVHSPAAHIRVPVSGEEGVSKDCASIDGPQLRQQTAGSPLRVTVGLRIAEGHFPRVGEPGGREVSCPAQFVFVRHSGYASILLQVRGHERVRVRGTWPVGVVRAQHPQLVEPETEAVLPAQNLHRRAHRAFAEGPGCRDHLQHAERFRARARADDGILLSEPEQQAVELQPRLVRAAAEIGVVPAGLKQ